MEDGTVPTSCRYSFYWLRTFDPAIIIRRVPVLKRHPRGGISFFGWGFVCKIEVSVNAFAAIVCD